MLDKLFFFNHFGNGDIFESREFIRDIMNIYPAEEYHYLTGKSKRLLLDLDYPKLIVENVFPDFLDIRTKFKEVNNDLYINTWIGRDSKYVLPGFACTLEMLYKMYNDILNEIDGSSLSLQPIDYLTTIDYSVFDIKLINKVVTELKKDYKTFVLISNGHVQSSQAENFDMSPLIAKLVNKYPGILFFVTSDINFDELDLAYTQNIINANTLTKDGLDSNLNELSYLSTFCKVIIGKNSGPQVFSWTKENCFSDKINITFTKNINCGHFVHHLPITMIKCWSSETDIWKLYKFVEGIFWNEQLLL